MTLGETHLVPSPGALMSLREALLLSTLGFLVMRSSRLRVTIRTRFKLRGEFILCKWRSLCQQRNHRARAGAVHDSAGVHKFAGFAALAKRVRRRQKLLLVKV